MSEPAHKRPGYGAIIGMRFGKLVVEKRGANYSPHNAQFWCVCDCGNKTIIPYPNLVHGKAISCGCVLRAHRDAYNKRQRRLSWRRNPQS